MLRVSASLRRIASAAASFSSASRWKAISSAKSRNMPIVSGVLTFAGRGSMAQRVPKNSPSLRMMGIET
ncbi:hypothetical protein [Teichococcus vastitatis]|uniref:Uncharacterized protein n=1 Tax=Teichococcus vastitatis TaxID=2307076 RepID=A0ABS9WCR0_9PROT|nr:hypothetical protein [Pseudoroseomonas vastitatis]MCI0757102.1 hypothetical protein [Pseudoroseomonas vastitatis]